jgi:hypothetical protein
MKVNIMSYHSQASIDSQNPGPTAGEMLAMRIAEAYLDMDSSYSRPNHADLREHLQALAQLGHALRRVVGSGYRTKGELAIDLVAADRRAYKKFQGHNITPEEHKQATDDYSRLQSVYEAWLVCEQEGLL